MTATRDLVLSDLTDRVRRAAPDNAAVQQLARDARHVERDIKGAELELQPHLESLLRHTKRLAGEMGRAIRDLQQKTVDPVSNGQTATSNFIELLEGRREPRNNSEKLVKVLADKLQAKTGEMAERAGLLQEDLVTGKLQKFVSSPNRFPQIPSMEMMNALARWDESILIPYMRHIVRHNNVTADRVEQVMREMSRNINSDSINDISRMALEQVRQWENVPAFVKNEATGEWVPVRETEPYQYFTRMVHSFAHQIGFRQVLGQRLDPDSRINALIKELPADPSVSGPVRSLVRALNGKAVEPKPFLPYSQTVRAVSAVSGVMKSAAMTMTLPVQMFEPFGIIQAMSGGGLLGLQDVWAAIRSMDPRNYAAAINTTLQELSLLHQDLSFNPNRPGESIARILRNGTAKLYVFGHRFQGRLAGEIARAKAERMKAGQGTSQDIGDAMAMLNITRPEARAMSRGESSPELYLALARRGGAFTTNSPMLASEQARLEHSRAFRAAFAFTRYFMMRLRYLDSQVRMIGDTLHALSNDMGNRQLQQEALAATVSFARGQIGTAIGAQAAQLVLSLFFGGPEALRVRWEETKESPWGQLFDAWLYATLGGPFGQFVRITRDPNAAWYTQAVEMTWPGAVTVTMQQYLSGTGRFHGMGWLEATDVLFDRWVPIKRALTAQAGIMGLGASDPGRDAAISAYRRHYRELVGEGRFRPALVEPGDPEIRAQERQRRIFRQHMRKAAEAMQNGRDPSAHLQAALGVDIADRQAVKASLRARRLLRGEASDPNSQVHQTIQRRIGRDAMEKVEQHDRVLNAWIERM